MGYLSGLKEYLQDSYDKSVFDQVMESDQLWCFYIHGKKVLHGRILENFQYDFKIDTEEQGEKLLSKTAVKFLYPAEKEETIRRLVKKTDKKVEKLGLEPIVGARDRHFIKNKTLYPLMKEKEVLFFTLLEGEIIRGLVLDFSRFDIVVGLKGGIPLTILRHSIYDVRNKTRRCFLKSLQQKSKDWMKSKLYIEEV